MQSIKRKKNDEGRMSEATSFTLVVLVLTSKYLPLFLINGFSHNFTKNMTSWFTLLLHGNAVFYNPPATFILRLELLFWLTKYNGWAESEKKKQLEL